jgi:hypothetical protein
MAHGVNMHKITTTVTKINRKNNTTITKISSQNDTNWHVKVDYELMSE